MPSFCCSLHLGCSFFSNRFSISESIKRYFSMTPSLIHTGTNNHPLLSALTAGSYTTIFFVSIYVCLLYYTICSQSRGHSLFIQTKGIAIWSGEGRIHVTFRKQGNSVWLEQKLNCGLVQHIKELDFIIKLDLNCDMMWFVSLERSGRWQRLKSESGRLIKKLLQ